MWAEGGGSSRLSKESVHALTARASEEEQKLFSRMSAVFKDGVLPELNDEWSHVMVRQMGMPVHLLREKTPKQEILDTLDRAKRCALVPPQAVPCTSLSHMLATAPGSAARASWSAGDATEPTHTSVLHDLYEPPARAPRGRSKAQRELDIAIRIAKLSRPSPRHVNTKPIAKSLSPRRKAEDEALKPVKEEAQVEAELTPVPREVDDEEPPFQWPDLLWYTPNVLDWEKNGGKQKPPAKNPNKKNFRFKWYWDRITDDEHYLQSLTFNQAYRGRIKANNLSEEEQKQAKMKAQQIRYMWSRRQVKDEEYAAFAEKIQKKQEQKERKEEEARLEALLRKVRFIKISCYLSAPTRCALLVLGCRLESSLVI